ncbi:twin-arginine translocation signal domain-containing protein [Streptomyces sp. NPDC091266]|uniref:twin-arginine translocation signal domain-containing protein n=1 Tax=Streptomyces sp. NPDC091266 TaxID=3365978 RepID=UPI0037FA99A2
MNVRGVSRRSFLATSTALAGWAAFSAQKRRSPRRPPAPPRGNGTADRASSR